MTSVLDTARTTYQNRLIMSGEGIGERLDKREGAISGMFNEIAPKYDFINHLLSLNIDVLWRKRAIAFLKRCKSKRTRVAPFKVIDIACGTGDSTIALYKNGIAATGIDIAQGMLDIAIEKNGKLPGNGTPLPEYINASAENIPFGDETFSAATICFGIRNFDNRGNCLKEIYRVIEKGGNIAVLEFAEPRNKIMKPLYSIYLNHILPAIGGMVSKKRSAYKYLALSIEKFPKYGDFCSELSAAGFKEVKYRALTGGVALLYTGEKS